MVVSRPAYIHTYTPTYTIPLPHLLPVARIQGVRADGWCGFHGYPNDAKLLVCDDGWRRGGEEGTPVDGSTVISRADRWTDQL